MKDLAGWRVGDSSDCVMNLHFEVCGGAAAARQACRHLSILWQQQVTTRFASPYTGPVTELIQVVGGAVLDSLTAPTRLLVARRTAPERFAGMWEFPGGKVEAGEEPRQALHRELKEELGIDVHLGEELIAESALGWPLNKQAVMRVWFAEIRAGQPEPLQDHDELRWVSLLDRDDVFRLPWIPADLPIVRALQGYVYDVAHPAPAPRNG